MSFLELHTKAKELYKLGEYDDVIYSIEKALLIEPKNHEAWFLKGNALYNLGRYEKAALSLKNRAFIRDPADPESWGHNEITLACKERCKEAIASYDKNIEIDPDDRDIWFHQGLSRTSYFPDEEDEELFPKRFEEAIASFDIALKINPTYFEAWSNRGIVLVKHGRYSEAITSFDKALEINPAYFEAWHYRGIAFSYIERYGNAVTSYDKAIELNPDNEDIWYHRGFALAKLKKYEKAEALFPKRFEEAITSFDKALEINPAYFEAWSYRGIVLVKQCRYSEAITSFDKALEINPSYFEAWHYRGIAFAKLEARNKKELSFEFTVPESEKEKAVQYLVDHISEETMKEVENLIKQSDVNWLGEQHHGFGMWVRNRLRGGGFRWDSEPMDNLWIELFLKAMKIKLGT